ncbi:helix-turn-helix domain-containing protein [Limosilactobacillus mucosae]|uniref:helix-turn-helix domain-containing protein n=1 Tax=Limosilactobacillus mucosae TaxID=97478 RepID=UPI0022DF420E|nr:helix-turn-helix domain-containing protein [Limosilactobacillus mucosae]
MSRNEESDKTVKRSNWDSLLPAAVRYDSRLKGDTKVLYSEILLLSNKAGYCYATDQHLAALFDKRRETINRYIKSLVKYGYIKIKSTRQGKTVVERKIYPLTLPKTSICQNSKSIISRDSAKLSDQTVTKSLVSDQIVTKVSDQIVTVNDSNSNDSKKELEREQEGQQPAAGILYNGLNWYESLGSLDGRLKLLMDKYLTSLPINVIQYAIDKAANKDNVKSSYAYLSRVLADYQENNINTLDKLEKLNADRYKQLGMNQLKESDKNHAATSEESSKLSPANAKPKTKSISEWQKEQQAISQHDIDENRKYGLPEWLDAKTRESEFAAEKERESNSLDDTKSANSQLNDKGNNDNQQTRTQPQQEQIKVKDDQPAKPNREPRMNQQEQINVALGLAALRKGEQLSSYQISLIERFDDNEKDLTLLKAYKAKKTSPTTNQG